MRGVTRKQVLLHYVDLVDLLRKVDIQLRLKKAVLLLFKTNQHVNHQKKIHQRAET